MDALKEPRVVIFDLDGTLTESKGPMTVEMGEALAALMAQVPVGIMSGGSFPQFEKQLLPFFPPTADFEQLYLFPTSASCCYVFENGAWSVRYNHAFSEEERARVLSAFDEALKETGFAEPVKIWGPRIEDRGSQITFSALGQQAPVEEKRAFDPDRKKRIPLQMALTKRLPGFSVRVNAYSSIDVTREGMTKAYGVKKFSEMLNVPIPDMLYVGDALFEGGNDAIVKETGVPTREVGGPAETLAFIRDFLDTQNKRGIF